MTNEIDKKIVSKEMSLLETLDYVENLSLD